jgi:hypothetical protein
MKIGTWAKLNEVEENLYEAKALLDVMSDGLCNDTIAVSQDAYATTVRLIYEKVEKASDANQELFKICREEKDEKPSDEWKEWEGETSLWPDDREVELAFQDGAGESRGSEVVQDDAEIGESKFPKRLSVELKEEKEDGSAVFEVSGSKEDMHTLFETFFINAVVKGVEVASSEIGIFNAQGEVIKQAKELNKYLSVWEESEDLNYDPEVKNIRMKLDEAIRAMERCGKAS